MPSGKNILDILRETKKVNDSILSAALHECIKSNLYSATDFSDVVSDLKRQRRVDDTATDNDETVTPLNKISGWIM